MFTQIRVVTELRPASPFPSLSAINSALAAQCRPQYLDLHCRNLDVFLETSSGLISS